MEKNTKVLLGVLIILIVGVFLLNGQITGKPTANLGCRSAAPEVYIKDIGNTLSVDWSDTSTYLGQVKYEVYLYKANKEEVYDLTNYYRKQETKDTFVSFSSIGPGEYVVKVRARNKDMCVEVFSDFGQAALIKTIN